MLLEPLVPGQPTTQDWYIYIIKLLWCVHYHLRDGWVCCWDRPPGCSFRLHCCLAPSCYVLLWIRLQLRSRSVNEGGIILWLQSSIMMKTFRWWALIIPSVPVSSAHGCLNITCDFSLHGCLATWIKFHTFKLHMCEMLIITVVLYSRGGWSWIVVRVRLP